MSTLNSLRLAIGQHHSDAENKRQLAHSLMSSAEQHAASGDEVRARLDRESAERYMHEAESIEGSAAAAEQEVQRRQQQISDIDKKIEDRHQRYKHDVEQLEKDKKSVTTAVLSGSEMETIRREVNNKRIDHKEQELHERYKRDIEQFEKEKSAIVG